MTACDKVMGATHPCTCGADEARQLLEFNSRAVQGLIGTAKYDDMYRVRFYEDRIAISRVDGERLSWDEVQKVKLGAIGDVTAIEVYPPKHKEINLRHTRHLWHGPKIADLVNTVCRHPEFYSAWRHLSHN